MLFCSIYSCIKAKCMFNFSIRTVGITVKETNGRFMFEFGNPLILSDLDCVLKRVQEEIRQNESVNLFAGTWPIKIFSLIKSCARKIV